MPKHDFYADPTLFDQWQADAGNWFIIRFEKLYPYAWSTGFAALGLVFLSTAAGLLITMLHQSLAGVATHTWGQLLAQVVTLAIALVATQSLLSQALDAWPKQIALPKRLHTLVGWLGFSAPVPAVAKKSTRTSVHRAPQPGTCSVPDRQATREFLAGVRAAGVNVTIARALFSAGIRSARHLRSARDEQLRCIHGVGSATVRRLRVHFG